MVRETLARFLVDWVDFRRQGEAWRFLFTTTAEERAPRRGVDVLRLWEDETRREEAVDGVRDWVSLAIFANGPA